MRSQTWLALAALMLVMLVVPSCDQVINYPPPKLTAISPSSVDANSPQLLLKVQGNNLVQQTQVSWITASGAIPAALANAGHIPREASPGGLPILWFGNVFGPSTP